MCVTVASVAFSPPLPIFADLLGSLFASLGRVVNGDLAAFFQSMKRILSARRGALRSVNRRSLHEV